MRILFVFGTRPEAIKLAPVIKHMSGMTDSFEVRTCVTAQHRRMLDEVLTVFDIKPDHDLDLMRPGQELAQLTASIISSLSPIFKAENPDCVIVQGDTTSAMAAALCAFYAKRLIAHVEAGLRTGDKYQPFPEEINRKLISAMADFHFAPTSNSAGNLAAEGIDPSKIFTTGNTGIDAIAYAAGLEPPSNGLLASLPPKKKIVTVTIHRRENFGKPLDDICSALLKLAHDYENTLHFVLPVHPNPNVAEKIRSHLKLIPNITLTEPLDYLTFVHLLKRSLFTLTDSGGIQEEAPALNKPVLVLRNTTERPEAIQSGHAFLVGTDPTRIVKAVEQLIDPSGTLRNFSPAQNPYGDAAASRRICEILSKCS